MSWEAWGDGDDGSDGTVERLMDAGWWPSEKAKEVEDAIKALRSEPVYENGDKANGISTRFLMRVTLLEVAAELRHSDDPLAIEASAVLATSRADDEHQRRMEG